MKPPIDRRAFLRGLAAGGAVAAAGALGVRAFLGEPEPWDEAAFPTPGSSRVAVIPATRYDRPLEATVLDGLVAIGADVRGARVLLKPNLVEFDPATAINTDPRLGRGDGARAPASWAPPRSPSARARATGATSRTSSTRSGLARRARRGRRAVRRPQCRRGRAASAPARATRAGRALAAATVARADVVVSMPKMKTHHWAGVTLSLKNLFGTRARPRLRLAEERPALGGDRAVASSTSPAPCGPATRSWTASWGWKGNGPISGEPGRRPACSSFGDDPVATDVVAASLMGVDPEAVPYLVEAGRFLGQARPREDRRRGRGPVEVRASRSFRRPPRVVWSRRADVAAAGGEAQEELQGPWIAPPMLSHDPVAGPAHDEAQRQRSDDHVVERADDGQELGDQIDRGHEPDRA